jgi:hypothetical protein
MLDIIVVSHCDEVQPQVDRSPRDTLGYRARIPGLFGDLVVLRVVVAKPRLCSPLLFGGRRACTFTLAAAHRASSSVG